MTDPAVHPEPLPARPSIEQLRKRARDLQRAARRPGDRVHALVAALHPSPVPDPLTLSAAQLVVARTYGFASWPRLAAHVAVVAEHQRVHAEVAAGADPAAVFLSLACLSWSGDDGPHRLSAARAVLQRHPGIGGVHVAAARADAAAVAALLRADPGLAGAEGGPQRWAPLMHLACARHDPDVTEAAVLDTARELLRHGADPDTGYLLDGLPTPFTVLTGAFGGGEGDQPPHPHAIALAGLLLTAGADPNDGQALYNRQFRTDDSHLRLLLAHGLGTGDGGPWHRLMPEATDSPAEMLAAQLRWAARHGHTGRIRLLAAHGVDVDARSRGGRTPAELAAAAGHTATVAALVGLGAGPPRLSPVETIGGAALAGDAAAFARACAEHPGLLERMRTRHPGLLVRAAATGRAGAVRLLVGAGFAVDGRGRSDVPVDEPWQTALHTAAERGDAAMVEVLLELGADTGVRDARFDATPAGWARHCGHDALADRLDQTPDQSRST